MLKYIKIFVLAFGMMTFSACSLDLLDNPNAVTPDKTNPDFLLNAIQLNLAGFFNGATDHGMRLTRMLNQGAAIYANAYQPTATDGVWTTAYAGILTDVKTLIPIAERSELFVHAGIARVIRAYVMATLVDTYGDVPFTEATDPNNLNPAIEGGASVYQKALADLDQAIVNFNATSKANPNDYFYRADKANWIRAANSLKLKLLLSRRLVDNGTTAAINSLIASGTFITNYAQSLTFKYSTNLAAPDSRHPRYAGQYLPTGGGDYQANFYMWHLYNGKGFPDPRIRYYIYRQVIANSTDVNEIRCIGNQAPAHWPAELLSTFCYPTNVGYWGRDHLSNEGIPPDGLRRSAWGLYPAGGNYDNNAGRPVTQGAGAGGAGIQPIMMSSYVDFMLAESALTLGTTGNPRTLLESAVRKSMADVRTFALGTSEAGKISTFETAQSIVWADKVNEYVTKVLELYDNATTNDARLDVIAREYWLALYGNGIEAYNLYRRTGKPGNMQPAIEANPGNFVRSLFYPAVYANRNLNAKQKANVETQVFWDNNPAGFIK